MKHGNWALVALAMCAAVAPAAGAQRRMMTVRIGVTDTTNAPVDGADVSLMHGLQDVLAHGTTNAAGLATFTVPYGEEDDIVVRKIGYQRADRFFTPGDRDSIVVHVLMHFTPHELAPVQVNAQEDVKRKSYFIDADGIEHATRYINDGLDVMTKLRPDILRGRSPGCGVRDVFVNGRRVIYPPIDELAASRIRAAPGGGGIRGGSSRPRLFSSSDPSPIAGIASVLASIKPEHIESFDYEDCFSTKVAGTHTQQALFVVLKPGVAFEPGIGSYVIDAPQTVAPLQSDAPLPRYRLRLLGVYDGLSGSPLDSADVIDTGSGLRARTLTAGTVLLSFLNEGTSNVAVHRDGFRDTTFAVKISPTDTVPITVVLRREK